MFWSRLVFFVLFILVVFVFVHYRPILLILFFSIWYHCFMNFIVFMKVFLQAELLHTINFPQKTAVQIMFKKISLLNCAYLLNIYWWIRLGWLVKWTSIASSSWSWSDEVINLYTLDIDVDMIFIRALTLIRSSSDLHYTLVRLGASKIYSAEKIQTVWWFYYASMEARVNIS